MDNNEIDKGINATVIAIQGQRIARLREALAFAASVIKSGERWSDECERIIGGALSGEPK